MSTVTVYDYGFDIPLLKFNGTTFYNGTSAINIQTGQTYQINNVTVLSATALGSSVVSANLTSNTSTSAISISSTAANQAIRLTGTANDGITQVVVMDPNNSSNQLCLANVGGLAKIGSFIQGVGASDMSIGFSDAKTVYCLGFQNYTAASNQLVFRPGGVGATATINVVQPTVSRIYTVPNPNNWWNKEF